MAEPTPTVDTDRPPYTTSRPCGPACRPCAATDRLCALAWELELDGDEQLADTLREIAYRAGERSPRGRRLADIVLAGVR